MLNAFKQRIPTVESDLLCELPHRLSRAKRQHVQPSSVLYFAILIVWECRIVRLPASSSGRGEGPVQQHCKSAAKTGPCWTFLTNSVAAPPRKQGRVLCSWTRSLSCLGTTTPSHGPTLRSKEVDVDFLHDNAGLRVASTPRKSQEGVWTALLHALHGLV